MERRSSTRTAIPPRLCSPLWLALPRMPEWIYEQDTNPGVTLADPIEHRHRIYERIPWNGQDVTCRPDARCLLSLPRPQQPDVRDTLLVYFLGRSS